MNDRDPTLPPTVRPPWAEPWLLGALGLALLHLLWLGAHFAPAIMSPDANGYVVLARLLAEQGRTSLAPTSPAQYIGMHWLETADGLFHSRYPAGLPLLQAAAWKVGGLTAALWINPLLASATVLLVFLLARRLVAAPYALLAAAIVATVPVTNQHALDADAHVAAAFFILAGITALLRFGESRKVLAGLCGGLCLGTVPTIRYPEAIVGIAIAAWLLWQVRPVVRAWPAVVGALLPIGALCLHNTAAYGTFWRTGYALTNEQTGFGLRYLTAHAIPYLQALGGQGVAVMFGFGVAGLVAMAGDAPRRSVGLLFSGIVAPLVLLYMAYYFGGPGGGAGGGAATGNLRFLIPTFPFFAVAAVWLLAQLAEHLGRAGRVAVGVVAALQLLVGVGSSAQSLATAKVSIGAAARVRAVAEKEIPAGSVVIVDRQLAESLDVVGRWRLVEEGIVAGLGGPGPMGFAGGPGSRGGGGFPRGPGGPEARETGPAEDDPSPMQRGKNRAQQERYAGLRPEARRARVWSDLRAWAAGNPIFWITRSLDAVDRALPQGADFRSIAEVDAPMMPGPGGGPMGGLPGRGPAGGRGFMPPPGAGPTGGGGLAGGPPFAVERRGGDGMVSGAKLRLVRLDWTKP